MRYLFLQLRTENGLCLNALAYQLASKKSTQDQLNGIVANAQSRSESHDCNWHASEDGGWGVCLCEIRIITDTECIRHLSEGECTIPGHLPKNKQWTWMIDCAPRGKLYPNTCLTRVVMMGDPHVEAQACRRIMLTPPPKHWVLARNERDTIHGRTFTDIIRYGSCITYVPPVLL